MKSIIPKIFIVVLLFVGMLYMIIRELILLPWSLLNQLKISNKKIQ